MSAITAALRSALAHRDSEVAKARGTSELLQRVINATFDCPRMDVERHLSLTNLYRELVSPGPPLTGEQVAKIEKFLAEGK